jgi:hypothetical protein
MAVTVEPCTGESNLIILTHWISLELEPDALEHVMLQFPGLLASYCDDTSYCEERWPR